MPRPPKPHPPNRASGGGPHRLAHQPLLSLWLAAKTAFASVDHLGALSRRLLRIRLPGNGPPPLSHLAHRGTPILDLHHSPALELVREFGPGQSVPRASRITEQGVNNSRGYSVTASVVLRHWPNGLKFSFQPCSRAPIRLHPVMRIRTSRWMIRSAPSPFKTGSSQARSMV